MLLPCTTMSYVYPEGAMINDAERDRKNYLSYYKRALAYLGLSRNHAAIADLNAVLEIQPDFSAALAQRGKILAKEGDFANAVNDLKKARKQDELVVIQTTSANPRLMTSWRPRKRSRRRKTRRRKEIFKIA